MIEKIAKVYFIGDYGEVAKHKAYHYFTLVDDLEVGDKVVVETRNGYKVVEFGGYIMSSTKASAYIVHKIDVEKVNKAKERKREITDLEILIKEKSKEIEERKKLDELAKEDISMKELLKKYDSLKKMINRGEQNV